MKTPKSPIESRDQQFHAQLAQVLHQVVGERIVVVQNQNHVQSGNLHHALENKSEKEFGPLPRKPNAACIPSWNDAVAIAGGGDAPVAEGVRDALVARKCQHTL